MQRRITVRLSNEGYEKLRTRSRDAGFDLSFLVRNAIAKCLDSEVAGAQTGTPPVNRTMPAEAFVLTGPYRAWSGDLRAEVRRQFTQLLAASHTCAQHWPKTPGVRESYAGLLELCSLFGLK